MIDKYFLLALLAVDFIWLRSSFGKLSSGNFINTLKPVLEKFSSHNPYPLVKGFLQNTAIPNYRFFGFLTLYGELVVALLLFFALFWLIFKKGNLLAYQILLAGLFGGVFLNAIFWFSSGWMSPASDGINLLMFLVQLTGIFFVRQKLLFFTGQK